MACKQYETGKETDFDTELTDFVVTDLRDKGLVRFAEQSQGNVPDFDLKVSITEKGIEEIKSALQKPHSPTQHFPVEAIKFADQELSMPSGFPLSSEGFKIILNDTLAENIDSLIIKKIMTNIDHFNLLAEEKKELLAEIQTVEVQLSSPKPKAKIIGYAIASAKALLEKEKRMSAPAFVIIHNIISIMHTISDNYKDKVDY